MNDVQGFTCQHEYEVVGGQNTISYPCDAFITDCHGFEVRHHVTESHDVAIACEGVYAEGKLDIPLRQVSTKSAPGISIVVRSSRSPGA